MFLMELMCILEWKGKSIALYNSSHQGATEHDAYEFEKSYIKFFFYKFYD